MGRDTDTLAYLDMLFRPGEIIEIRVKQEVESQSGTRVQTWLPYEKLTQFAQVHIPIHESHKRHIWVGVCPRNKANSTVPLHGRALWADLDASVTTTEGLDEALKNSGLPTPTLVVNSGNGYHVYWAIKGEPVDPDTLRRYVKAVHERLPADATHDPTRVMRVPGTKNFKTDPPKDCGFLRWEPSLGYSLSDFPSTGVAVHRPVDPGPTKDRSIPMGQEDFDLFVANWLDGHKHSIAVGVAGYLRKNLMYSRDQALETIRGIHQAAGYDWPDRNLMKVVDDTYETYMGRIAGLSKLAEFGVYPKVKDNFTFAFKKPKVKAMSIIDFTEDIQPQEFWIDGLVGPGMATLWAAEPKTGKSFAAMQMGYALSTGQNIWDFKVNGKHRVLYFQGELSKGMVADRAINMFGQAAVRNPRQFAMTDKPDKQVDLISNPEVLNDLAENYDVIIIDPISAFNANDENHSNSVRETLSVFDSLKAKGKAVILIHHTRKLDEDKNGNPIRPSFNAIRGSSAWFAFADAIALHYRMGAGGATQVKFMFRAAPEREPLDIYRMPNGGFSSDRREFLATQTTLKADLANLN